MGISNNQSPEQIAQLRKQILRDYAVSTMQRAGNKFQFLGGGAVPENQISPASKGGIGVDTKGQAFSADDFRSAEIKDEGDGNFAFYHEGERLGDAYDIGAQPKQKKSAIGKILKSPAGLVLAPGLGVPYAFANSITDGALDKGAYQIERFLGGHGGRSGAGEVPVDAISDLIRRVQAKASGFHEKGLEEYGKEFGRDAGLDSEAHTEIEGGVRGLIKGRDASRREVQSGVASRGLQNSSRGLGAQMATEQAAGSQISALRSDIKNRVQNLKKARTEKGMELSSSVLGAQDVPIDFYGRKPERMGGILPLLGGITGAYFGARDGGKQGGAGFQAGMGAGQYAEGYGGY
jgi:hypothetical protein